jgi:hypothetical protein
MEPRPATTSDVAAIAQMHVQCWQETYPDLLPAAEIAARDLQSRMTLWAKVLGNPENTTSIIPDVGFALIRPQTDAALADSYPHALQSLYVLRTSYSTGAGIALLTHVTQSCQAGFTAAVLKGNSRAISFYINAGGLHLKDVTDADGYTDHVYGWSVPIQLRR